MNRSYFSFPGWSLPAIAIGLFACRPAPAVVVVNPIASGNTTAPLDDPGWHNVPDNFSGIYLGNQWVLTARHAAGDLQNLRDLNLPGGTFAAIPNSYVTLQNPTGQGLIPESDLMLYRVNTLNQFDGTPEQLDANLKQITLIDQPVPIGGAITMIGRGLDRVGENLDRWTVNQATDPWTWTLDSNGSFQGYKTRSDQRTKRWGTNILASDELAPDQNDPDNQVVIGFPNDDNPVRQILANVVEFTAPGEAGSTANEAQAIAGDSGGPAFYNNDGTWELAGVMHAIFSFSGQRASWAVFENLTAFTDLSVPAYRQQIQSLLDQADYSVPGDINLDGVAAGDGSGPWDTDDVTAFIEGWLYEQAEADIISWKKGDLSQDGRTDLDDFLLLRGSLPTSTSVSNLGTLLGVDFAVPEPSSLAMLLAGILLFCGGRRRARLRTLEWAFQSV